MFRRVLAALFVLSIALSGCSGEEDEPSSAKESPKARDAWMAGDWWTLDEPGGTTSGAIKLETDGRGARSWVTTRPDIAFGLGDESSAATFEWWSENGKLVLGGVKYELVSTPNCRLVKIGDTVYEHYTTARCPFEVAPLTPIEAKMVGEWSLPPGESTLFFFDYLILEIKADRFIRVASNTIKRTSYFHVDAGGQLRGTNVDGKEEFHLTLVPTENGLSVCDTFRRNNCNALHRD